MKFDLNIINLYDIGMKYLFWAVCLLVAPLFAEEEHVIDDSSRVDHIYVLNASSGSFEGKKLTLNGVSYVIYFHSLPHRAAGHIKLPELSEKLDNMKPSGTLALMTGTQEVLKLENPRVRGNTISFTVEKGSLPKRFQESLLYIDMAKGH